MRRTHTLTLGSHRHGDDVDCGKKKKGKRGGGEGRVTKNEKKTKKEKRGRRGIPVQAMHVGERVLDELNGPQRCTLVFSSHSFVFSSSLVDFS